MMHLSFIINTLMITSCAGAATMVRSKGKYGTPRIAPEDKTMTTGFSNAEDLPTLAENGKANTALSASTVAKAGASGPSFSSEDGNGEHPNVVDKMAYDTQNSTEQSQSSSLPMFLFLACGSGAIAWMYASEEKRSQAKDKANAAMHMLGPLVQEAVGAVGIAMQGASSATNAVRHTSIHSRFLQQSSYQRVSCDDDDLIAEDEEDELDDGCNLAAGIEESFIDQMAEDELLEDVPQLMEVQPPPLDLFDAAAPALDVTANDLSNQPSLLDFGAPDNSGFEM
jgi:hypothetical protein